jgi:hypothetical protein
MSVTAACCSGRPRTRNSAYMPPPAIRSYRRRSASSSSLAIAFRK